MDWIYLVFEVMNWALRRAFPEHVRMSWTLVMLWLLMNLNVGEVSHDGVGSSETLVISRGGSRNMWAGAPETFQTPKNFGSHQFSYDQISRIFSITSNI